MTSKGRNAVRLETEIEKSREESRWNRVIELAEQLKQRSPTQETLADFLLGEGKLESFLEDNPPIEANISKAKNGLNEAKKHLLNATTELGKKERVALDGNLLLGKLNYACGRYSEALTNYSNAELDSLTEKELPSRGLKIVAESYAIKGLCLEKVLPSSTSKFKQVEHVEQTTKCFELASDLTLLYLQELDKLQQQTTTNTSSSGSHSPQPPAPTRQIGPILETALQRAPLLYIQTEKLNQAVARYRSMLSAVESSATQSLRLTLTRQLAEVLLRGLTGALYAPPAPSVKASKKTLVNVSESPWKPRQYTGFNLFIPTIDYEEVILLLLISEAMAVRDTVLSQSPEFEEARLRALENAKAVYDLLAVAIIRWGQAAVLNEVFERAMKFSFEEKHIWMQHALCLVTMGKYFHALAVLREVKRLLPDKTIPCLIAARICYENLERPKEGVEWCKEAIARETAQNQHLMSRCLLYLGIGYHIQAQQTFVRREKQNFNKNAKMYFNKALECDPDDHLAEYYLALYLACSFQITEATKHAKNALWFQPEHAPSLQLLVLLLTAQKQHEEASQLLSAALEEYPDDLNLLYLKAHIELYSKGGEVALITAKHMLGIWKVLYEEQTVVDVTDTSDKRSDTKSTFQLYTAEMSDKDSSSLHAQSIVASRVEHALSEVASSLSSFTPRPGPQRAWVLQVQIWLLLAEIYIEMDELQWASACVQEATTIYPLSHQVMFTRGLIHERKKEFKEARQWFQNATAINPAHVKSLQHLGLIYHYLGCQRLAEKTLRDAARLDPNSHLTWYNLGIVLESLGECESASDCMATALEVETTSPLLPFTNFEMPAGFQGLPWTCYQVLKILSVNFSNKFQFIRQIFVLPVTKIPFNKYYILTAFKS